MANKVDHYNEKSHYVLQKTADLVKAEKEELSFFAPIDQEGLICLEEAYWAKEEKNPGDMLIWESVDAFIFWSGDEYCMEVEHHTAHFEESLDAVQCKAEREMDLFENHVAALTRNGCTEREALGIAISHLTGLPWNPKKG